MRKRPSIRSMRASTAVASVLTALAIAVLWPSSAAANPGAGDYVCGDVTFGAFVNPLSSGSQTEPYSATAVTDCKVLTKDYPHTTVKLDGNITIRCGAGATVVGTLTFADGTNPSVTTSAAVNLQKTQSGTPGLLSSGAGLTGEMNGLVSDGAGPPTMDLCGGGGDPIRLEIDGSIAPGSSQVGATDFGDWIYYNEGYLLSQSQFQLEDGTPVTDGTGDCDAPDANVTLDTNQTVQDLRELAFNPVTCQYLVETGVPPLSEVASAEQADASATPRLDDSGASSALQTPATGVGLYRSHGYWRTWWEDPVGIDVTVVGDGTDWHYDGVNNYPPVTATQHFHWYDTSGWGLFEHNWQHNWSLQKTTSSTYAHFANGSFPGCFNHETHIWFNRNTIHGDSDGRIEGIVHSTLRGLNARTCIRALHFHHRLQRLS
jgi:hypothetical protein